MLAIVVVSFTVVPGVAVAGLNAESIVSSDTVTLAVHRGSALPAGQSLPGADEVTAGQDLVPGVGVVHGDGVSDGGRPAAGRFPVQLRVRAA